MQRRRTRGWRPERLEGRLVLSAAGFELATFATQPPGPSGAEGDTTLLAASAAENLTAPRDRPTLNAAGTTFVADNGQLLRGPFTSTEWTPAVPATEIAQMRDLGFNALHLYAEVFDPSYDGLGAGRSPGYAAAEIDKVVAATRDAGMYLVMTIGNGANNGDFNHEYAIDFWEFYAPRYADETHVVYEVHNEPVAWSPPYNSPNANPTGALDMQVEAYNTIRSHAPDTPVLLFTYAVPGGENGASAALGDLSLFNQAVFGDANRTWTNEAVGFHAYGGFEAATEFAEAILDAGYPLLMTEYSGDDWGAGHGLDQELIAELERIDVSWLTFQHVPPTGVAADVTDAAAYADLVEIAGLSWTPDYGAFPAIRGPYTPSGLAPRTGGLSDSLRIEAEDYDHGGPGVAYSDTTVGNSGAVYRPGEDVDLFLAQTRVESWAVGATAAGEWLEYTLWVQEPGYYDLTLGYSAEAVAVVQVDTHNRDKTGAWTLPASGGEQAWTTASREVFLEFGRQKVRIQVVDGSPNLDWFELTPSSTGAAPNGQYRLVNRHTGLFAEADTANNLLTQGAESGGAAQRWNLTHRGAGNYSLGSAANPSRYWNGSGDTINLNFWGYDGADDRRFLLNPTGDGFYTIQAVGNGRTAGVEDASFAPGADINRDEYAGDSSQQWALLAPSDPLFPTQLVAGLGAAELLAGDYNGDGAVDSADYVLWRNTRGASVAPGQGADGDRNGSVDDDDLAFWKSHYGNGTPATPIRLDWAAVPGASEYHVLRRGPDDAGFTTLVTGLAANAYEDASALPGIEYAYAVTAVVGGQQSLPSGEVVAASPGPTRPPLEDTHVRDGFGSNTNYGASDTVAVKGGVTSGFTRYALLKFDVSGLAEAQRVTLGLTPRQVDGPATFVYELVTDDSWTEADTLWGNQPAASGVVVATVGGYAVGERAEIDITAIARREAAGDGILSLRIRDPFDSDNYVGFHSSESSDEAARPSIEYALGAGGGDAGGGGDDGGVRSESRASVESSAAVAPAQPAERDSRTHDRSTLAPRPATRATFAAPPRSRPASTVDSRPSERDDLLLAGLLAYVDDTATPAAAESLGAHQHDEAEWESLAEWCFDAERADLDPL